MGSPRKNFDEIVNTGCLLTGKNTHQSIGWPLFNEFIYTV